MYVQSKVQILKSSMCPVAENAKHTCQTVQQFKRSLIFWLIYTSAANKPSTSYGSTHRRNTNGLLYIYLEIGKLEFRFVVLLAKPISTGALLIFCLQGEGSTRHSGIQRKPWLYKQIYGKLNIHRRNHWRNNKTETTKYMYNKCSSASMIPD
jgi:hypothetical protein